MIPLLISNLALVALALRFAEPGRAPLVRTPGWTVKVVPGERVYMPCEASGDPEPSINWERDGMPVSLFGNRFSVNAESQALKIFNVKVDDRGNYTCIAKNPFGVDIINVVLLVMVQPECKIISPTNFTFMELTNQELVCRSRGFPQPSFEWLTNRHQRIRPMKYVFDNMTTSQRLYSVERRLDEEMYESVLFLQPITFRDLGSFVCVSYNAIGSGRDAVSLDVRFSPKVLSNRHATIPISWWAGHPTNLTCAATGNRLPEIVWTRNGQLFHCANLEEWVHGSEITSTCTIKDRFSGGPGNYTCTAENSLGKILVHNFIVKEIFPPPGVDVRPMTSSPDEVLLSVTVPPKEDSPQATSVLVSYRIYAGSGEGSPQYQLTADVDNHGKATVKLVGIRKGSDHEVTVKAMNIAGFGPETTIIVNTDTLLHTATLQPSTNKPTCNSEVGEERYKVQPDFPTAISPNEKHNPNNTTDQQEDIFEHPSNNSAQIALKVTATHSRAMVLRLDHNSYLIPCSCVVYLCMMFSSVLFRV